MSDPNINGAVNPRAYLAACIAAASDFLEQASQDIASGDAAALGFTMRKFSIYAIGALDTLPDAIRQIQNENENEERQS